MFLEKREFHGVADGAIAKYLQRIQKAIHNTQNTEIRLTSNGFRNTKTYLNDPKYSPQNSKYSPPKYINGKRSACTLFTQFITFCYLLAIAALGTKHANRYVIAITSTWQKICAVRPEKKTVYRERSSRKTEVFGKR